MNFYRFDNTYTIAAENEQQARDFYVEETGFEDDLTQIEKIAGYRPMWVGTDFLTEEEMNQVQTVQRGPDGGLEVEMSFDEVFKREGQKAPYIIASTER